MYTDLITPAEMVRASFGSLGDAIAAEVEEGTGDMYTAMLDICSDVTSQVEKYLSRSLIVRQVAYRFDRQPWCDGNPLVVDDDDNLLHTQYARQWPVVQWLTVEGDVANIDEVGIYESREGGELLTWNSTTTTLDDFPTYGVAFAGYRRSDQTIAGGSGSGSGDETLLVLDDELDAGLDGLTVLPPLLPGAIRRVALRLAIKEAREQLRGVVGLSRQSKRIEQLTVESETVNRDFVLSELMKLNGYRFLVG